MMLRGPHLRQDVAIAKKKQTKPTKTKHKNPNKPTQANQQSIL